MGFCWCSLAGTSACKYCANNPDAEPSPYRTYTTTSITGTSGYYCMETGMACEYATELGFCQLTACAKPRVPYITNSDYSFDGKTLRFTGKEDIQEYIDRAVEIFKKQLEEAAEEVIKRK